MNCTKSDSKSDAPSAPVMGRPTSSVSQVDSPLRVRERAYRSSSLASRGKGGRSRCSTGAHVPNRRIGEPWRILSTLWARPRFRPNRPPTGSFVSTSTAEPGCRAPHWDRLPLARLVVGRQAGTKASTIPFLPTRETRETRPDDVSHNPEVVGSNPTPATTKALVAAIQGHAGSGSLGHLIGAARVLSPQPVEDENRA